MDGSAAAKVTQTHNVCTHISTLASRDACSLEVTSGRVYIMLSCVDTLTCSGICSWQGQKRSSTGRGVVLAVVAGAAVLATLALTAPQGNSLQQIQLARPAAPAVSWTSLSAAQQQALKTQVMESASVTANENERATIFDLFICMPRSLLPQSQSASSDRCFLRESSYQCSDSLCYVLRSLISLSLHIPHNAIFLVYSDVPGLGG